MKLFIVLLFTLSFSVQAQVSSNILDNYGNRISYIPLKGTDDLGASWNRITKAIGAVAVPGFGKNAVGTGYFITDKLFVTSFLTVDHLRRSSGNSISIWVKDQYFRVKNAKALYGPYNIAVLEIESSYKGGVLKLSEDPLSPVYYGIGVDVLETYLSDTRYYITADDIMRKAVNGEASRIEMNRLLSFREAIHQQDIGGYKLVQLNTDSLDASTNGLPLINDYGDVVAMKLGNIVNFVYATPVNFLKEVLNGKGNCGDMSIQKCLDKATEELYEKAKAGDSMAQYMHDNRMLYTAYLDEMLYKGNESVELLRASANAGNPLSQINSIIHTTSNYKCFKLPNQEDYNHLQGGLKALGRLFENKEKVQSSVTELLDKMQAKGISLAYYLRGRMFLSGNCVDRDIQRGLSYLEVAAERGIFPALNILIDNYSLQNSPLFNITKANYFVEMFRRVYNMQHRNPTFNVRDIDHQFIIL